MKVVEHAHAAWFLLADGEALLLDVNCNHGAFGYSVLIELDPDERTRWERDGRDYLDELARSVHDSAPAANEVSPYRARDLTRTRPGEVGDAVRRWREATGTPRP